MKRNTRATAVVALCLTTTMSLAACGRSTDKAATPTDKAGSISSGKAPAGVAIDIALVRAAMKSSGGNHLEIQVS